MAKTIKPGMYQMVENKEIYTFWTLCKEYGTEDHIVVMIHVESSERVCFKLKDWNVKYHFTPLMTYEETTNASQSTYDQVKGMISDKDGNLLPEFEEFGKKFEAAMNASKAHDFVKGVKK